MLTGVTGLFVSPKPRTERNGTCRSGGASRNTLRRKRPTGMRTTRNAELLFFWMEEDTEIDH